ncbi:MAG: 50S ribosomal protein L37ae [Promethearchaeota archaeon]
MGKTKKVGITGRFGSRYGAMLRKRVRVIEENMKAPKKCPKCETKVVKRLSVGIWYCKKCGAKFTGGAYDQKTQPGVEAKRNAQRLRANIEKLK